MRYILILIACLALIHGRSATAAAADAAIPGSLLITTESRWEGAALISAAHDLKWTFKSPDGGQRAVEASKVVRWGNFATASGGHRLRLSSGGEVVGRSVEIRDNEILIESDLVMPARATTGAPVRLPRESVAAVIFDMPADPQSVKALEKRITSASADTDTLLFTNGDQLTGRVLELAKDKLTFKSTVADVLVDRARVAALILRRSQLTDKASDGKLLIWVGLRNGSRLVTRTVLVNDTSTQLELIAHATVAVQAEEIVALQPIGGDALYVSDLSEAGYRHIPFLSQAWDFRRDSNVTGGALMADGHRYLKGLGMHSAARITYNLDRGYREFQCALAIDDSTEGRGSVTCRIFTDDGSGQWRPKFESPIIRGGERPIPIEVDLAGAKRLSLLVDFADRGDEQDHINWLDARLIR